jgi:hypothetical protein
VARVVGCYLAPRVEHAHPDDELHLVVLEAVTKDVVEVAVVAEVVVAEVVVDKAATKTKAQEADRHRHPHFRTKGGQ